MDEPVLHIHDILLFLGDATCNSRAIREGAKLEKSRAHLFAVGRVLNSSNDSTLQFRGACLTSTIDASPHTVEVTKKTEDDGSLHLEGKCSCKAGTNRCKHVVALMFRLQRPLSEIETVTCTGRHQGWGKIGASQTVAREPSRILDLCHVKDKKLKYPELPRILPTNVQDYVFNRIIEVVPESITCKCMKLMHDAKKRLGYLIRSSEYESSQDKRRCLAENLEMTSAKIRDIEEATRGQSKNPRWFAERKNRLTASTFGLILAAIERNSYPTSLFDRLLEKYDLSKVPAIKWGREHEAVAISDFTVLTGIEVQPCGIWIHECGVLGASPDGLIGNDIIVEVKCPYTHRFLTIDEMLEQEKNNRTYFVHKEGDDVLLNREHAYWHQIQAQLLFTDRVTCTFIIWLVHDMIHINVPRDPNWKRNVDLLVKFYIEVFVPEVKKH